MKKITQFLFIPFCLVAFYPGILTAKVYDDGVNQVKKEPVEVISKVISLSIPFRDGGTKFDPSQNDLISLQGAERASMIFVSGRTSTGKASWKDEQLALGRALSTRQWLVEAGVDPLRIFTNFASATDFIVDNTTREGRKKNQRVDIRIIF